jgi:hypothetical protein
MSEIRGKRRIGNSSVSKAHSSNIPADLRLIRGDFPQSLPTNAGITLETEHFFPHLGTYCRRKIKDKVPTLNEVSCQVV